MIDHADELRVAQDAALTFANHLRQVDGREPVPALMAGVIGNTGKCPVAATANMGLRRDVSRWEVGPIAVKVSKGGNPQPGQTPTPAPVREFMAAFDAGAYPELEAGRMAVVA